jgi:hypothetical protein
MVNLSQGIVVSLYLLDFVRGERRSVTVGFGPIIVKPTKTEMLIYRPITNQLNCRFIRITGRTVDGFLGSVFTG